MAETTVAEWVAMIVVAMAGDLVDAIADGKAVMLVGDLAFVTAGPKVA